jgi:hypothetical protein
VLIDCSPQQRRSPRHEHFVQMPRGAGLATHGGISIAPSTRTVTPSILCCTPSGTRLQHGVSLRNRSIRTVSPSVTETVIIDKSGASLAALDAIDAERETPIKIRQSKYLNILIEQDHRAIKRCTRKVRKSQLTHISRCATAARPTRCRASDLSPLAIPARVPVCGKFGRD